MCARQGSVFFGRDDRVHEGGKGKVLVREAANIVGAENHVDIVVDVEPLGVVAHLLGLEGHAAHEAPSLTKVLELELLLNGITVRLQLPACTYVCARMRKWEGGGGEGGGEEEEEEEGEEEQGGGRRTSRRKGRTTTTTT